MLNYKHKPQDLLNNNYDAPKAADEYKPIFCFDYITKYMGNKKDYCLKCGNDKDKASDFLDKIHFLSSLTWKEINSEGKQIGCERIALKYMSGMNTYIDLFDKDTKFMVFRLKRNKDKTRFMGIRDPKNPRVFQVCAFDKKGKAYSH